MATLVDLLTRNTSAMDCINAVLDSNIPEENQLEMVIHLEWLKWSKQTWNKAMSQMTYDEFKESEKTICKKWLDKAILQRTMEGN